MSAPPIIPTSADVLRAELAVTSAAVALAACPRWHVAGSAWRRRRLRRARVRLGVILAAWEARTGQTWRRA